jgi:hypothetical protein
MPAPAEDLFDEVEIAASVIRRLGTTVTIERRPSLEMGTDEIWTIMAHAGGYGFGQGGTLAAAIAEYTPRATPVKHQAQAVERIVA